MKLNATAEMMPVTFPNFTDVHPFAPVEQAEGYQVDSYTCFSNRKLRCVIAMFHITK